jgi:hypothetical protein
VRALAGIPSDEASVDACWPGANGVGPRAAAALEVNNIFGRTVTHHCKKEK